MSATNKTAVYELPIFLGSDVPSWLTDWNGAMGDIDTAIAAAKAAADAAASTAGTAATDIVTINGQITSLQNTVGTHTTQIGTISGNINTINSLIGNGTPTTTDQTIIGAINELHANQGDLDNLQTTDKSSLVAAINEAAQGGGGSPSASAVSYDNTVSGLTATNVQSAIDELATGNLGSWTVIDSVSHTGSSGNQTKTITADLSGYSELMLQHITNGTVAGSSIFFPTDAGASAEHIFGSGSTINDLTYSDFVTATGVMTTAISIHGSSMTVMARLLGR